MMSGLVSPQSIGLSNEKQIYKMITISKFLFKICKIIPRIASIFALVFTFWTYLNNFSFKQLIIFGIPHSILLGITCFHIYNIIVSQIVYFYIICYYLKLKLKLINDYMRFKLKSKSRTKITLIKIIYCLHSIYGEIHDFNCNY